MVGNERSGGDSSSKPGLTRREFMGRAAGVIGGVLAAPLVGAALSPRSSRAQEDPFEPEATVETTPARNFAQEALANKEKLGPFVNRVGWAYSAKPGISQEQMILDMQKMKDSGMNVVYISHINPGYIDKLPMSEPGLSYAVYHSIRNNTSTKGNADQLLGGVNKALLAASRVGLPVALAIGYQIQMGREWAATNPNHIRREPSGAPLNFWDQNVTASPYSPLFRQSITEYWRWVNDTILAKNPNVLALNLGDEPMGSDYSAWAKQAFKDRYGVDFDAADPNLKGYFQSGVLADYAKWAAEAWQQINPNVKVFFTFHIQRDKPFFPSWDRIFAQTPDNFVFSNDTHMHDDLPDKPMTEGEKNLMYGMVRSVSWLSRVYGKGFMPWLGVTGWSLAFESSRKGGITEGKESLRVVTDIAKQNGALMPMVMAWGWNLAGQGLFDTNRLPFDPKKMAQMVQKELSQRRDSLSDQVDGRPDIVYLVDSNELYTKLGQANVSQFSPDWGNLNSIDFINQNAIWLADDNGPALELAKQMGSQIVPIQLI